MSDGWIVADGLPLPEPGAPLQPAACAGDVLVQWDNTQGLGDWSLAIGDLQTGQDLETACLVSLFSDVLATPDFVPTDGTTDRRGWWATPYLDMPLGSNLWQLDRAKKTRDTLGLARTFVLTSLQWLITDGIAAAVDCNTAWLAQNMLGIAVAITQPDGTASRFAWGWPWGNMAQLVSPVSFPSGLIPQPARRIAAR